MLDWRLGRPRLGRNRQGHGILRYLVSMDQRNSHAHAREGCTRDRYAKSHAGPQGRHWKMCSHRSFPMPLSLMTLSNAALGYFCPLPEMVVS
jgi:hypothetical protein